MMTGDDFAFPMAVPDNWDSFQSGMSLRDWFAGQALNGWLSEGVINSSADHVAERCYAYADAMIRRRNNLQQGD
jgi:hypothetical protein